MKISTDKHCEHAKCGVRATDGKQGNAGEPVRLEHPVEGVRGLALRVMPDGTKSWALRYRRHADGVQRRLTLGTYPDVRLKDAKERARKAVAAVADGDDPAGDKQHRRAGATFEALAGQWVEFKRRQGRADSYMGRSEQRIASLPQWFRETKAADIERVNVTAVLDTVAKRGVSTETNRVQALISAVLKWAVSEGLLERDVSQGIKRRFEEVPRERVLSDDEVRGFWLGIAGCPASEASKIAMRLCFVLGQRPKEIAHLRKSALALDAPQPTATVDKVTSKNRIEHVIPLPRLAVELLRQACALSTSGDWVFPSPKGDGPIDPHTFAKVMDRERRRSANGTLFGIRDAQLYDSKKAVATFLGNAGYPDQFIGLLFNHLTAKGGTVTGKHYNHARYMQQKREMVELWARHLEGVLGIAREDASANVIPLRSIAG